MSPRKEKLRHERLISLCGGQVLAPNRAEYADAADWPLESGQCRSRMIFSPIWPGALARSRAYGRLLPPTSEAGTGTLLDAGLAAFRQGMQSGTMEQFHTGSAPNIAWRRDDRQSPVTE